MFCNLVVKDQFVEETAQAREEGLEYLVIIPRYPGVEMDPVIYPLGAVVECE